MGDRRHNRGVPIRKRPPKDDSGNQFVASLVHLANKHEEDESSDEEVVDLYGTDPARRIRTVPTQSLQQRRLSDISESHQRLDGNYRQTRSPRTSGRNVNDLNAGEAVVKPKSHNFFERLLAFRPRQYSEMATFLRANLQSWDDESYRTTLRSRLASILRSASRSLDSPEAWRVTQLILLLSGSWADQERATQETRLRLIESLETRPNSEAASQLPTRIINFMNQFCAEERIDKRRIAYRSLAEVDAALPSSEPEQAFQERRQDINREARPSNVREPQDRYDMRATGLGYTDSEPSQDAPSRDGDYQDRRGRVVTGNSTLASDRQSQQSVSRAQGQGPQDRHNTRTTGSQYADSLPLRKASARTVNHQGRHERPVPGNTMSTPDRQPQQPTVRTQDQGTQGQAGLFARPEAPSAGPTLLQEETDNVPGGLSLAGPGRFVGPATDIAELMNPSDRARYKNFLAGFKVYKGEDEKHAFSTGSLIAVFWHENAGSSFKPGVGESMPKAGKYGPGYVVYTSGDQPVFSHIRRFIVIKVRQGFSLCIPISTYGGKGVVRNINDRERRAHARVFDARAQPANMPGEKTFTLRDIGIEMIAHGETLTKSSRLYYAKIQSIDHNIKIKHLGRVCEKDIPTLLSDFNSVFSS